MFGTLVTEGEHWHNLVNQGRVLSLINLHIPVENLGLWVYGSPLPPAHNNTYHTINLMVGSPTCWLSFYFISGVKGKESNEQPKGRSNNSFSLLSLHPPLIPRVFLSLTFDPHTVTSVSKRAVCELREPNVTVKIRMEWRIWNVGRGKQPAYARLHISKRR